MRLIDADALMDTVKKKICGECINKKCERNAYCSDEMMMMLIDAMPTVDAVPVVRCEDCKWARDYKGEMICGRVPLAIWTTMPERYCVDGERRSGCD